MHIGILTGGGDVPGLNACIKAVVQRADESGWKVTGFKRGWAGPLHFNPDDDARSRADHLMPLSLETTRTIDRTGGTILHTSRTNPGKVRAADIPDFMTSGSLPEDETLDCTEHVLRVMEHLGIDVLIPIGGDDTLSYAARLDAEGFRVLSIPKTMDNDVFGTDYCIGFSTAVSRSIDFIDALRTPTGSHERFAVIELFGRNSGETALISGHLTNAERTLISEVPFDIGRLADMLTRDRADNPGRYAIVVVSEGAAMEGGEIVETGDTDPYGHRKLGGIGQHITDELQRRTGIGVVNQSLAYLMRAGPPDSLDRMVASSYGTMAVQFLEQNKTGFMMALQDGNYTAVPVGTCISGIKRVDVDELYDVEAYRPKISSVFNKPMFLY